MLTHAKRSAPTDVGCLVVSCCVVFSFVLFGHSNGATTKKLEEQSERRWGGVRAQMKFMITDTRRGGGGKQTQTKTQTHTHYVLVEAAARPLPFGNFFVAESSSSFAR